MHAVAFDLRVKSQLLVGIPLAMCNDLAQPYVDWLSALGLGLCIQRAARERHATNQQRDEQWTVHFAQPPLPQSFRALSRAFFLMASLLFLSASAPHAGSHTPLPDRASRPIITYD